MQDRELLELAAKAAGQSVDRITSEGVWIYPDGVDSHGFGKGLPCLWNPLAYDGDALRLAVKLRMKLDMFVGYCSVSFDDQKGGEGEVEQDDGDDGDLDDFAVTRRAIVRAAAEIGKNS